MGESGPSKPLICGEGSEGLFCIIGAEKELRTGMNVPEDVTIHLRIHISSIPSLKNDFIMFYVFFFYLSFFFFLLMMKFVRKSDNDIATFILEHIL